MAERTCQLWLISGRVQGVGYRAWMAGEARTLGVDCRVRNLADGRVEAFVTGDDASLMRLHRACCEGPYYARVDGIEVRTEP